MEYPIVSFQSTTSLATTGCIFCLKRGPQGRASASIGLVIYLLIYVCLVQYVRQSSRPGKRLVTGILSWNNLTSSTSKGPVSSLRNIQKSCEFLPAARSKEKIQRASSLCLSTPLSVNTVVCCKHPTALTGCLRPILSKFLWMAFRKAIYLTI